MMTFLSNSDRSIPSKARRLIQFWFLKPKCGGDKPLAMRAMDIGTVLPHALGIKSRDFNGSVARLAAATGTAPLSRQHRPRQLLALALRKEAASQGLLDAARNQGWLILDATEAVLNRSARQSPPALTS